MNSPVSNRVESLFALAAELPRDSRESFLNRECGDDEVGFAVSSVDDTYASLLSAGGTSVAPPKDSQWGRRAVVADPDGHRVELSGK